MSSEEPLSADHIFVKLLKASYLKRADLKAPHTMTHSLFTESIRVGTIITLIVRLNPAKAMPKFPY